MGSRALEQLAERWISLWTAPVDWKLFDELHADSFQDCASAGRPADKTGFADGLRQYTEAFPDLVTRVDDLVVDSVNGKIAIRWTAHGTNTIRFLGTGPTNKRL